MDDYFTITERRCKICSSKLREQIDDMILGESEIEGRKYKYIEIAAFAAGQGLEISLAAITRHRTNHVMPSMRRMLETERNIEAIAKATGKRLSIHRVFANMVTAKVLRRLEELDDDDIAKLDIEELMRLALMAGRNSLHIEKAEDVLEQARGEVAEKVGQGLEKKGISQDTITLIEKEILGL